MDLLIYLVLYYFVRIIYVFALNDIAAKYFEEIINYCKAYNTFFPISFVLGFFVSTIMTRWWSQYTTIPRPHGTAVYLSASLQGNDDMGKALRRTIVRYTCCAITMVFRRLSPRVLKRFPNESDLIDAGLIDENEYAILHNISENHPGNPSYVVPLVWATTIVTKSQKIKRITSEYATKTIIDELNNVRTRLATLINYETVNISLVYSQVVTLAVYSYFLAAIFGTQTNRHYPGYIDFGYFPIFLILQFVFYMGWLKVAEALMNPFGDDDDDFDVFKMVDDFLLMSYFIVDKMHDEHPTIIKDLYWGNDPTELFDHRRKSDVQDNIQSVEVGFTTFKKRAFSNRQTKFKIDEIPNYEETELLFDIDAELLPKSMSSDIEDESNNITAMNINKEKNN
jgi:hypothetical protein